MTRLAMPVKKNSGTLLLLIILSLGIGLRLINIAADPPQVPVPADGAFCTDQGWYNHNVIHKITTGSWFMPVDRSEITHTALFGFIQYAVMRSTGFHYWAAKLQPLMFSLLTIVLVFYSVKGWSGYRAALIVVGAFSINYLHVVYSNAALVEPTVIFFLVGSLYCWGKSRDGSIYYAVPGGVSFYLGFMAKSHALHFLVLMAMITGLELFVAIDNAERKKLFVRIFLYVASAAICHAVWYAWWIRPNEVYWRSFGRHIRRLPSFTSRNYMSYLRQYFIAFTHAIYYGFIRTPVLFAIAAVGAYGLVVNGVARGREYLRDKMPLYYCLLWIISYLVFFTGARLVRPRYQMVLLLPVSLLAVSVLFGKLRESIAVNKKWQYGFLVFAIPVMVIAGQKIVSPKSNDPTWLAGIAGVTVFMIFVVYLLRPRLLANRKMAIGLVGLYCLLQAVPFVMWTATRTRTIARTGRNIKLIMMANGDSGSYVLGPLSSTFALEGGFNTISGLYNSLYNRNYTDERFRTIIEQYRPRYVLHDESNIENYRRYFDEFGASLKFRNEYVYAVRRSSVLPVQKLFLYRVIY